MTHTDHFDREVTRLAIGLNVSADEVMRRFGRNDPSVWSLRTAADRDLVADRASLQASDERFEAMRMSDPAPAVDSGALSTAAARRAFLDAELRKSARAWGQSAGVPSGTDEATLLARFINENKRDRRLAELLAAYGS
ncbi:MAG: hypothetical protein AB7I38_13360 [Dehalococcoidia bacterium]